MNKEIKYNGYSAQPSDYKCQDGDLAVSINLVPENEALCPIMPPRKVMQFEHDGKLVFIHTTDTSKNYIFNKTNSFDREILFWQSESCSSDDINLLPILGYYHIIQVNAIGNTLVALTTGPMYYFLWKGEQEGYLSLGSHMPECPLSFGLRGGFVTNGDRNGFTVSLPYKQATGVNNIVHFNEGNIDSVTSQVLAKVNEFIADKHKKGKFIYPFFVRYAYRLYDGNLTMHSAPILMIAASGCTPLVVTDEFSSGNTTFSVWVTAPVFDLDYAVTRSTEQLKTWNDIIKSIDIFISAPIYTYDQNGKCTGLYSVNDLKTYSIFSEKSSSGGFIGDRTEGTTNSEEIYQKHLFTDHLSHFWMVSLPSKDDKKINEEICNCANFYLIKSIPIKELKEERTVIDIEENTLTTLVTREVMTDDYGSHDEIGPEMSYIYNNRLNIGKIKKYLFKGFQEDALANFITGSEKTSSTIKTLIKKNNAEHIVCSEKASAVSNELPIFLYYPDPDAHQMIIEKKTIKNVYNLKNT